jgi:hypothetical protein
MLPQYSERKGSSGNGIANISAINKQVLVSLLLAAVCVLTIFGGIWHCRTKSYSYSLRCDTKECRYYSPESKKGQPIYTFPRDDFVGYEEVNVRNQKIVVPDDALREGRRRRSRSKYGYSIQFEFKHKSDPDSRVKSNRKILLTPFDLGRRSSRSYARQLREYMAFESDSMNLTSSNYVSALGILLIFLGSIGLIICIVVGTWSDPTPKRVKKRS